MNAEQEHLAPARTCRWCEFYDGGGMAKDGGQRESEGDCHNRLSPRFQTKAEWTCARFVETSH